MSRHLDNIPAFDFETLESVGSAFLRSRVIVADKLTCRFTMERGPYSAKVQ